MRTRLLLALARRGRLGVAAAARADLAAGLGRDLAGRFRDQGTLAAFAPLRERVYRELWEDAARAVGADVRGLGGGFLELSRGGARTRVRGDATDIDPLVTVELSEDKTLVHRLLAEAGVPVPEHREVAVDRLEPALELLAGGPVVVKPAAATGVGTGVTGAIADEEELGRACLRATRSGPRILVERQLPGDVYRFLVLDGEVIDAIRRRPPSVVGDGSATIRALMAAETRRRLDAGGRGGLWPLTVDLDCLLTLRRSGIRLDDVPEAGRRVVLKSVTNLNRAEDNETVPLPTGIDEEVLLAARVVGLRLAGVDVVAPRLDVPLAESGGGVIEVNCTPGLHHHALVADPAKATPVAPLVLERLLG